MLAVTLVLGAPLAHSPVGAVPAAQAENLSTAAGAPASLTVPSSLSAERTVRT